MSLLSPTIAPNSAAPKSAAPKSAAPKSAAVDSAAAPDRAADPAAARGRLYVKTFGCQMNEYDTEKVQALLADSYRLVSSPEEADVVFVNTCSVREKGEHKLFSLLGSLRELKQLNPGMVLGVGGCVAQQEGQGIMKRNSAVDFVVGTHNLSLVPALLRNVQDGRGPQIAVDYREDWETLPEAQSEHELSPLGRVRALIAIQRGCNKRCAFCVVPTTRGPEVSRDPQEIIREAKLKARLGSKELLLLGQTVNSYGRDLAPRYPFERLIRTLAEIDGIERIRFTSPHPAEVRREFLELYGDVPQLCAHMHLPLQSGSDRVLKLMNRNYRMKRYYEIVDAVRARSPEIAVTTDIIVGFPTETAADFEQTLEVMRRVQFSSAYTFQYSRRPNTEAGSAYSEGEEVPPDEARARLIHLQTLQEEISRKYLQRFLGCPVEVLVEEPPPRLSSKLCGRIPQNTPIELVCEGSPRPKPGSLVWAQVDNVSPNGLRGVVLDDNGLDHARARIVG